MTAGVTAASFDFAKTSALITGGSRGIGASIAARFAAAGAHVFINYARDDEAAQRTAAAIEAVGGAATTIRANLANPDDIRSLFREVGARTDRLDFLIHNAALGSFKAQMDVRPSQWDLTMDVGPRALLLCAQSALPLLKAGVGRIVSLSSLGSQRVIPEYGAIGVSKAALESLTRYLAAEMLPHGIRVNAVSAGLVETDSLKRHPQYERLAAHARSRRGIDTLCQPNDVAGVVMFLCSPLADWIVGQTLIVDGGVSLAL